jgi:hypothetical protein
LPFLVLIILVGTSQPAASQDDPLQGRIKLAVEEPAWEGRRPQIAVNLVTVGVYPCSSFMIAIRQRRTADTIALRILGLDPISSMCTKEIGPAFVRVPLTLSPGTYRLAITRGETTDRFDLSVTTTRLSLRVIGTPRFVQPDTSVYLRPIARTFLVSCGTPNVPELCADFFNWLAKQPGIVRRPLSADDKIGFGRHGGYRHDSYQLFEYADDGAISPVRQCMRHLADTLAQAVGAGVRVQTADGQVFRAWSGRSLHEAHIPVPRKISGTRGCPE